jgi:YVTN family beta-propeller protein
LWTVAVSTGPQGIAVNPAGTFAYTANLTAGTVSVIDTAIDTVTATINTGGTPSYALVNPAGTRLYVTDQGTGTAILYVIDTGTNSVVATVNANHPASSYGLAINPAGTFVYVALANDMTLAAVSTTTNTVASVASTGFRPTDVQLRPGASELWVPNNQDSSISVIGASTTTIATPPTPYFTTFNAAGTVAYTSHSNGQVTFIDATTQTLAATFLVGGDPWTPMVDPSDTNLYVVNNAINAVQIINLPSSTLTRTIFGFSGPRDIAFGPAATGADISVDVSAMSARRLRRRRRRAG